MNLGNEDQHSVAQLKLKVWDNGILATIGGSSPILSNSYYTLSYNHMFISKCILEMLVPSSNPIVGNSAKG